MTKYFTNNLTITNLYKKPNINSGIVTQMIYGDSFLILKRSRKWLKIKIKEDGYIGFIKNKNFPKFLKPTHKVHLLKSKVFEFPNRRKISEISFGSKIKVMEIKKSFLRFSKGWINKNDVKTISYKQKDPFKKISIFKNVKYKWGGKTFKGIDCYGLVQIIYNYNNKFFPRDTVDQIKFKKGLKSKKKFKKGDIVFWKGHVGICINSKKFIHAYGPRKKVLIMPINQTIKLIEKTAGLKVKKIFSI